MSATETPLVTPDELNKRLLLEIDGYRMREQVGKEAFDKMRAELECARGDIKTAGEMLAARDALIGEHKKAMETAAFVLNSVASSGVSVHDDMRQLSYRTAQEIIEPLLARTPADAGADVAARKEGSK